MCGIAGFSLSPTSKIKPRQLSNALLTAIEDRGYMASGYAWQQNDSFGYFKSAVPGSSLSLKAMPKKARHAILHTRLATHGSVYDNRNNHPVTSPSGRIALVHNGVIYNHDEVRAKVIGDLPPVDTSVIPAVIEQHGIDKIDMLDGDAAIAWFSADESNTLHLARYQHSPLTMCQTEDGSFIFASTEALLWRALIQLDIMPTWMQTADELQYFVIRDGIITQSQSLPKPSFDSMYDYGYYRHRTSGAKSNYNYNPYNEPSYVPGYGWDDWDDYGNWETYQPRSIESQVALFSDDYWDEPLDADWIGNVPEKKEASKFYSKFVTGLDDEPVTVYYNESEREDWKNELYLLANENGVVLIDYGVVKVNGELVSEQYDIF